MRFTFRVALGLNNAEFAPFMKLGQLACRHLISSDANWAAVPAPLYSLRVTQSITGISRGK